MKLRNIVPSLSMLCMLALLAGCDRSEGVAFMAEDAEPQFEKGRQLERQGRNPEALSSFLKVISKRGDDAPESHLEVGIIYQQHIKDHIAAIYHFRKFIELQPNSRQAELVRQRIATSTREFARTLPANPLESANVRLGYDDQLGRLQHENDQLKAEIQALRAGVATVPVASQNAYRPGFEIPIATPTQSTPMPAEGEGQTPGTSEEPAPFVKAPESGGESSGASGISLPEIKPAPGPVAKPAPVAVAKAEPTRPVASPTPTPAAQPSAARKHIVTSKDTLSSISLRYYGTRTKVKEIVQANKDQLKGDRDTLKLGMELRIP